ncbi:MAG: hypothetical protein DRP75_03095, partial [Candidatus Omnitrophota bacterium]
LNGNLYVRVRPVFHIDNLGGAIRCKTIRDAEGNFLYYEIKGKWTEKRISLHIPSDLILSDEKVEEIKTSAELFKPQTIQKSKVEKKEIGEKDKDYLLSALNPEEKKGEQEVKEESTLQDTSQSADEEQKERLSTCLILLPDEEKEEIGKLIPQVAYVKSYTETSQYISSLGMFTVYTDMVYRYYDKEDRLLFEYRFRHNKISDEQTISISLYNGEIGKEYGEIKMEDGSIISISDKSIQYKIFDYEMKEGKRVSIEPKIVLMKIMNTSKVSLPSEEINLDTKDEVKIYAEGRLYANERGNPVDYTLRCIKNIYNLPLHTEKIWPNSSFVEYYTVNEKASQALWDIYKEAYGSAPRYPLLVVDYRKSTEPTLYWSYDWKSYYPDLEDAEVSEETQAKWEQMPFWYEVYNGWTGEYLFGLSDWQYIRFSPEGKVIVPREVKTLFPASLAEPPPTEKGEKEKAEKEEKEEGAEEPIITVPSVSPSPSPTSTSSPASSPSPSPAPLLPSPESTPPSEEGNESETIISVPSISFSLPLLQTARAQKVEISSIQQESTPSAQFEQEKEEKESGQVVRIVKDKQGWWWEIEGKKVPLLFGVVYQPVPDGRHITYYRDNYAELYRSLLPKEVERFDEGGFDHARLLSERNFKVIKVYGVSTLDEVDIAETKRIFRWMFETYGIRVIIVHDAGLYEDPTDEEAIKRDLERLAEAYKDEPWLLAYQISNENNYYLTGRMLAGEKAIISMSEEEYYPFMNRLAGAIKEVDENHPVLLGNGGLSPSEASLIAEMNNIDALSINYYREPEDLSSLLALAQTTGKPVGLGEFGQPSDAPGGRRAQNAYIQRMSYTLISNMAGREGTDNAIFGIVFEATDERWKEGMSPRGGTEARFGILTRDEMGTYDPSAQWYSGEIRLVYIGKSKEYKDAYYLDLEGNGQGFNVDTLIKYRKEWGRQVVGWEYYDREGRVRIARDPSDNLYFVKEFCADEPSTPKEAYLLYIDPEGHLRVSEGYITDPQPVSLEEIEIGGKTLKEIDDMDESNEIIRDLKKVIERVDAVSGKEESDYQLLRVEVRTQTGDVYYKYILPGDKYARAILTVKGETITVVTEWNKINPRIPMESYLVDVHNGHTRLYISHADGLDVFYIDEKERIIPVREVSGKETRVKIAPDSTNLIRVRIYNPNTGEIFYRWYRPYDLLMRWEFEERGTGDVHKDFTPDPQRKGYSRWNGQRRVYVGRWDVQKTSFVDKYLPGTDIPKYKETYLISDELRTRSDWNEQIGGVFAWQEEYQGRERMPVPKRISNEKDLTPRDKKELENLGSRDLEKIKRTYANGHSVYLYFHPLEPIKTEVGVVDEDRKELKLNLYWTEDLDTHSGYYKKTIVVDKESLDGQAEIIAIFEGKKWVKAEDIFTPQICKAYEEEYNRDLWKDLAKIGIDRETKLRVMEKKPHAFDGNSTTEVHYSEQFAPSQTIYINPADPVCPQIAVRVPKGDDQEEEFTINRWWKVKGEEKESYPGLPQGSVTIKDGERTLKQWAGKVENIEWFNPETGEIEVKSIAALTEGKYEYAFVYNVRHTDRTEPLKTEIKLPSGRKVQDIYDYQRARLLRSIPITNGIEVIQYNLNSRIPQPQIGFEKGGDWTKKWIEIRYSPEEVVEIVEEKEGTAPNNQVRREYCYDKYGELKVNSPQRLDIIEKWKKDSFSPLSLWVIGPAVGGAVVLGPLGWIASFLGERKRKKEEEEERGRGGNINSSSTQQISQQEIERKIERIGKEYNSFDNQFGEGAREEAEAFLKEWITRALKKGKTLDEIIEEYFEDYKVWREIVLRESEETFTLKDLTLKDLYLWHLMKKSTHNFSTYTPAFFNYLFHKAREMPEDEVAEFISTHTKRWFSILQRQIWKLSEILPPGHYLNYDDVNGLFRDEEFIRNYERRSEEEYQRFIEELGDKVDALKKKAKEFENAGLTPEKIKRKMLKTKEFAEYKEFMKNNAHLAKKTYKEMSAEWLGFGGWLATFWNNYYQDAFLLAMLIGISYFALVPLQILSLTTWGVGAIVSISLLTIVGGIKKIRSSSVERIDRGYENEQSKREGKWQRRAFLAGVFIPKALWNYYVFSHLGIATKALWNGGLALGGLNLSFLSPLVICALWLPFILFFFLDVFSFFYIAEGVVGYVYGKKIGVGRINSWKGLRDNFTSIAERFKSKIIPSSLKLSPEQKDLLWAKAWNLIIEKLYEEDRLNAKEKEKYQYKIEEERIVASPVLQEPPRNKDAEEELVYFANSLFMKMPSAPSWDDLTSLTVFTPIGNEEIIYSFEELNNLENTGVTKLTYLISRYPDEWKNFIERMREEGRFSEEDLDKMESPTLGQVLEIDNDKLKQEIRLWASYRFQPWARTLRGIMYYKDVLEFLARMHFPDASEQEIKEKVAEKFQYLIALDKYYRWRNSDEGTEERRKGEDIEFLMRRYPKILQIVHISSEDREGWYTACAHSNEKGEIIHSSRIRLPGMPILGQGKPEGQNNGLKFVRKERIMSIDINQDMAFQECFKIPNLLEEFKKDPRITLLGFPEKIFTHNYSLIGKFHAFADETFVTLVQRMLAYLGVRFHYGHPDIWRTSTVLSKGGTSQSSYLNEDIFGGYQRVLQGDRVVFVEYFRAKKGREVSFPTTEGIFRKFGMGAAEQAPSRYLSWLNTSENFGFSRGMCHRLGGIGFFLRKPWVVFGIYSYLLLLLLLGVSGFSAFPSEIIFGLVAIYFTQAISTTGYFEWVLEKGFRRGSIEFFKMLILEGMMPFFMAHVFTHSAGVKAGMKGVARYVATGRGFMLEHLPLFTRKRSEVSIYNGFGRSHILPGFILTLISLMGIALWQNLTLIWSAFYILMAFSAFAVPFLTNPGATLLTVSAERWWELFKEDVKGWYGAVFKGEGYTRLQRAEMFVIGFPIFFTLLAVNSLIGFISAPYRYIKEYENLKKTEKVKKIKEAEGLDEKEKKEKEEEIKKIERKEIGILGNIVISFFSGLAVLGVLFIMPYILTGISVIATPIFDITASIPILNGVFDLIAIMGSSYLALFQSIKSTMLPTIVVFSIVTIVSFAISLSIFALIRREISNQEQIVEGEHRYFNLFAPFTFLIFLSSLNFAAPLNQLIPSVSMDSIIPILILTSGLGLAIYIALWIDRKHRSSVSWLMSKLETAPKDWIAIGSPLHYPSLAFSLAQIWLRDYLKGKISLEEINEKLQHKSWAVRLAVIYFLEELNNEEAIEPLKKSFNDDNVSVCCEAKRAYFKILSRKLLKVLKEKGMSTKEMVDNIRKVIDNLEDYFPEMQQEKLLKMVIDLGIRLANQGILPCSTFQYGVPLAAKTAKGNIEWFKQNLNALEELAVELNKENINPFQTLKLFDKPSLFTHFSALRLRKGSSYEGKLYKNGLTDVDKIAASIIASPDTKHISLNIQDKQITFNIDRDLLTKLHLSDGEIAALIKKALDKDKLDVSNINSPITIALLDTSEHLFEDHLPNSFIGINKAILEIKDKDIRNTLLQVGIAHEMRHEATGRTDEEFEKSQLAKDISFTLNLLKETDLEVSSFISALEESDILERDSEFWEGLKLEPPIVQTTTQTQSISTPTKISLISISSPKHYALWNDLSCESLAGDLRGSFGKRVKAIYTKLANVGQSSISETLFGFFNHLHQDIRSRRENKKTLLSFISQGKKSIKIMQELGIEEKNLMYTQAEENFDGGKGNKRRTNEEEVVRNTEKFIKDTERQRRELEELFRRKGIREEEFERLIKIISTGLGEDVGMRIEPGDWWRYDFEENKVIFPADLLLRFSPDEIVGFSLHEAAHRQ